MAGEPQTRRVTFDPTINLGHVISAVAFVGSVWLAWTNMDKRVLVLEENSKLQQQIDRHQDELSRINMQQIREALADIKRGVELSNSRSEKKQE